MINRKKNLTDNKKFFRSAFTLNRKSQNRRHSQYKKSTFLNLETLEPRRLLSTVAVGVDADGDGYKILLAGPGTIVDPSLANLTLSGTTMASKLTITVDAPDGNGQVDVAKVDAGLDSLGQLLVQGDLGGLQAARIGKLQAQSLGNIADSSDFFDINGPVKQINISGSILDSTLDIDGPVNTIQVGQRRDETSNISNSSIDIDGNLNKFILCQDLTAGSTISVDGTLKVIDINGALVNSTVQATDDVTKFMVDGVISNSTIDLDNNLRIFIAKNSVNNTNITIGQTLRKATIFADLRNSTLLCSALDNLLVRDDLNNTQIGVTDDLSQLQADDSQGLTLRVSGTLENLSIRQDMDDALISALNGIGTIRIGEELNGSLILGGIDIGANFTLESTGGGDDFEWGNVTIEKITIGRDMIDSSIAAGVSPRGPFYGDGDDEPTAGDIGTARINRIIVRGDIASTNLPGETYAISAADGIDLIRSGRRIFTGTADVLLQEF
ncbi:MAG: hypothetical protein JXD22_14930 [Sedimentisphaerales bacterium]|nr:hypothetical protein [Sedimentisphaerales bacterium]